MNGIKPNRGIASLEEVHAFYERLPYPLPLTTLDEHRELYQDSDRRRFQFHLLWPMEPLHGNLEILIAGCGTSQAARYALRERDARVTAIDISEMSLLHTRELQRKYDLDNLELHQLSIESVRKLGRTFDLIVCTGVLHHLPDPDLGLRSLRDVLKPEGAMSLMVYAPYGRAGIYMLQEYCRFLGISLANTDLNGLAYTLRALPANHPVSNVRGAFDFNHPESLADALLHPLDRAYSVPELFAWLERCGMSFGRWVEQAPYLPQCGIIAKTPHVERLASLPAAAQAAAVELFRGTMIRHKFVVYRDDSKRNGQTIDFAGTQWQKYVPIRLPSSACFRDRLPPDCAAVLINRAHPFTDLILTVDEFEDRLLSAIDGKRTLKDILDVAGNGNERVALRFFERLWQYDQVVFDASRVTNNL